VGQQLALASWSREPPPDRGVRDLDQRHSDLQRRYGQAGLGPAVQRPGETLFGLRLLGRGEPAGTKVYVTGTNSATSGHHAYATAAYSAATGRLLLVSRYNGPRTVTPPPRSR
jgi:hypothetical protein